MGVLGKDKRGIALVGELAQLDRVVAGLHGEACSIDGTVERPAGAMAAASLLTSTM